MIINHNLLMKHFPKNHTVRAATTHLEPWAQIDGILLKLDNHMCSEFLEIHYVVKYQ